MLKERPWHMQSVFLCNPRWDLNPDYACHQLMCATKLRSSPQPRHRT